MSIKRKAATSFTKEAKKTKINGSITSFFGSPNPKTFPVNSIATASSPSNTDKVNTTPPANSAFVFNKEAWAKKLTNEQRKLLKLEIDTLHESWLKELKDDVLKPSFLELKRFLAKERENGNIVFPPENDIYSWSRFTPLSSVKAVILGQDPYHNTSQAHGLSFSVNPPTPPPPSLRNIFITLRNDYPNSFKPPPNNTGQLTPWAWQGVLMLNTCLTVRKHEANSHANRGWEAFTQRVIDIVAMKRKSGVVFLAWGTPAGKRVGKIDKARHLVLTSVHPSPLSASRGWFECGHFRKTNEWLVKRHGPGSEIDWNLGERESEGVKGDDKSELKEIETSNDSETQKSAIEQRVCLELKTESDSESGDVHEEKSVS